MFVVYVCDMYAYILYKNILHESIFVCTKDLVYTFVTSVKNKEKGKTEKNRGECSFH